MPDMAQHLGSIILTKTNRQSFQLGQVVHTINSSIAGQRLADLWEVDSLVTTLSSSTARVAYRCL